MACIESQQLLRRYEKIHNQDVIRVAEKASKKLPDQSVGIMIVGIKADG